MSVWLPVREKIRQQNAVVLDRLVQLRRLKTSGEALSEWQAKEKDAQFRLRFYAQHGMEEKLERQTTFGRDERYLSSSTSPASRALDSLQDGIRETLDGLKQEQKHESAHNRADIDDYREGYDRFTTHLSSLNTIVDGARQILDELNVKQQAFLQKKAGADGGICRNRTWPCRRAAASRGGKSRSRRLPEAESRAGSCGTKNSRVDPG